MAASALKPGGRLGPYELLSPIGAGGMGEVWRARDTRLDRVVAIKFSQAQFTDRFEREARAIAALNHPNIGQIYDVGENYIVMEFVEGDPVRPPDTVRKLLDIAVQIADGLAAAHKAGFIHRDLKPDNILLTKEGRAKILDFGLAKQAEASAGETTRTIAITDPGSVLGTVAYMSPEQARGQELDARSDQFSFGLILYELAAGKRAFVRDSSAETMTAIIREDPEPLAASVPALLRWTIERLLSKDPDDRYASTKDLFAELRGIRTRLSEISAVPVSATPAKAKRVSRAVAATAGILAIVAIAMLWRAGGNQPTPRYRFTPFAATAANETTPVWSPDGRTIAYHELANNVGRLMIKSVDRGTAPVALAQGNVRNVSWSPDGERIYYSSSLPGRGGAVMSVARAGGQPTSIPNLGPSADGKKNYYAPALSPDGRTLAVIEVDFSQQPPVRRLMFSSPPGAKPGPVGELLPCCGETAILRWSPDSSRLLVRTSPPEGATTLRSITRAGHAKLLMRLPALVHPGFSWVGGNRYFVIEADSSDGDDQGLHLADAESGQITTLLPSATRLLWPSASADGTRIAYVTRTRLYELLEIPLSGEPARPLALSQLDQHSVAFSPKRNEFAFVRIDRIIVRDRERNEERVLVSGDDYKAAVTTPAFS
jgi:eukaryotic-like serine/threonine-protein kinase